MNIKSGLRGNVLLMAEFQFACNVRDLRVMQTLKQNLSSGTTRARHDQEEERVCRGLRLEFDGRAIVIFMVGDKDLFAMDQKCYRKKRAFTQITAWRLLENVLSQTAI